MGEELGGAIEDDSTGGKSGGGGDGHAIFELLENRSNGTCR